MAVWMQRYDGACQIMPVMFGFDLAYLRDFGWTFPRLVTTETSNGEVEIERIGEDR